MSRHRAFACAECGAERTLWSKGERTRAACDACEQVRAFERVDPV